MKKIVATEDAKVAVVRFSDDKGKGERTATRIRSVMRAARLIRLAAENPSGIYAEDARKHLRVSAATAYHILNTLADEGMLSKRDRRFFLGPTAGLIADAYSRQESTPPYILEPLAQLARTLGETASLSVWRNGSVAEIAVYEGGKPLQVGGRVSGIQPDLHARASGKLLLAELSDKELRRYVAVHPLRARTPKTITNFKQLSRELALIRERGWASEHEECDVGVACLAVSVTADAIAGAGAYTIGAPAWRLIENEDEYRTALFKAAQDASGQPPRLSRAR